MELHLKQFLSTIITVLLLTVSAQADNFGQQQSNMLQFKSDGHVIAFSDNSVHFAALDHMMKVEFVGGEAQPVSAGVYSKGKNDEAPEFRKVTYDGLWPGVEVVYEKENGSIAKVTYIVNDAASAGRIHLKYNRNLNIDGNGNLELNFETGKMIENAPVAWQIINGQRKYVQTGFNLLNSQELGFSIGSHNANYPIIIDPSITWHTFLGSASEDQAEDIAVDGNGYVYVTGRSSATWGTPVRAYTGGIDAFVAKLNSSGSLLWNTFLGDDGAQFSDVGYAIAVDDSGNVYVAGYSDITWESPVNNYAGGYDGFAVKLDSSGVLQWNTFFGSTSGDIANGIALDGSGNIYITGSSFATWGSPVNAFAGGIDGFAVKLNNSGDLLWNTFMGSASSSFVEETASGIAVDAGNNVYITGNSYGTWGSPINAYTGNSDAFAAKLNTSGVLQWNTFMGTSSGVDFTNGIALDGNNNVYIVGYSDDSWGSPINSFGGGDQDVFAAKLNSSGALQWNTFMGSSTTDDYVDDITIDGSGRSFIVGTTEATWGSPLNSYSGSQDAFLAVLNADGSLNYNTFFGNSGYDIGSGIALDGSLNVYLAGYSNATWGTSPVNPYLGSYDAFVIKYISGLTIPTLTEWTAIILGLSLALVAVWQIRRFFA